MIRYNKKNPKATWSESGINIEPIVCCRLSWRRTPSTRVHSPEDGTQKVFIARRISPYTEITTRTSRWREQRTLLCRARRDETSAAAWKVGSRNWAHLPLWHRPNRRTVISAQSRPQHRVVILGVIPFRTIQIDHISAVPARTSPSLMPSTKKKESDWTYFVFDSSERRQQNGRQHRQARSPGATGAFCLQQQQSVAAEG